MRLFAAATLLIAATPIAAQIKTPDRAVTDPNSVSSSPNASATAVPVEDIGTSRGLQGAAWSADGRYLFVSTNLTGRYNIWRTDTAGSWPVQLTQSDDVQGDLATSSDGKWLYFAQDKGGNEYYDLYRVPVNGGAVENLTNTPERSETSPLPGPGGMMALTTKLRTEGQSNLAVIDAGGTLRALTREADAQYSWSAVAWTEGGKAIIANRDRVDLRVGEIWHIDVASGAATRLLGKADTYYRAADATGDGALIAVSTNDGGSQLRAGLYAPATSKWRWLNPTPWEQTAAIFTRDGKSLIFTTNADTRSTLYRLDLASGAETPLGIPPGANYLSGTEPRSPDGRLLIVNHSGADSPTNLYLYDLAGGTARPATQLAMASLAPAILPKSQVVTYKSFDGTLVSAIVTMPFNLKRDGSNPAIVLPHGGPTGQAQDGFSRYAAAFASRGYVTIQPNFRGSTGYGKAFQEANYKDLGGGDLKDTVAAKAFLVSTGYVDAKRVGIFGGSYGGFMTLMAIGRTPDEFAAAVQWFGIINWRTMYRDQDEVLKAYQRGLIGTPESDPKVYDAASPLTYIRAAKAPLLTIQGENDIRVPRGQAQEVNDILKAKGNIVETVFYPAEGHGFQKRENQLDSLKRTVAWFDKYLEAGRQMMKALRYIGLGLLLLAIGALAIFHTPDTDPVAMRAKYADASSQFLDLGGGLKVHVRDTGPRNAPVLVLVHGSNASLHTWQPWAERLQGTYRVIRYDAPGHGLTGPNPTGDYSTTAFVDVLDRVVNKAGVRQFALAGNSMGGGVAWHYALAHPERVTKLILVDSAGQPFSSYRATPIGFRIARLPVLRNLATIVTPRSLIADSLPDAFYDRSLATDKAIDLYWELLRYPGNRMATVERFGTPPDFATPERLGRLKMPVLILWGANDKLIPLSSGKWLHDQIPGSAFIVYPKTGHVPMEERADQSARDAAAFLAEPIPSKARTA